MASPFLGITTKTITELSAENNESINSTVRVKRNLPEWLSSDTDTEQVVTAKRVKVHTDTADTNSDSETVINNNIPTTSSSMPIPVRIKIEAKDEETETAISSTIKIKSEIKDEPTDDPDLPDSSTTSPKQSDVKQQVVVKSEATNSTRDSCRYGVRCYRRNARHRSDKAHPGDIDYRRPDYPAPPLGTPICPFGDRCYRRNPVHFTEYSHPPSTDFEKNWQNYKKRLRERRNKIDYSGVGSDELDDDSDADDFIDDGSDIDFSEDNNSSTSEDSN